MALPNTKNNFFARLMGKTTRDKFAQADQNPVLPGQVQNRGLTYSQSPKQQFPPQSDFITGSQPTQPSQPQTQTGQPQQQQPGTVGAQQEGRYRLMQMIEPKPERDQEGMDVIQRRAKINAIGKGFSALAGLGGMAMGGDAPVIPDMVTPFNLNQIQTMDADYRNRLQDWVNRSFQVEAANNQTLNRETDQTIDAENRRRQIELQGENDRKLAQDRADAALRQLNTKSEIEQAKEMESIGINPKDPKAFEKYLAAQQQKFKSDLDYNRSRTSANNYRATEKPSSGGPSSKVSFTPEQLAQYQRSRDAMISAEQAKLNGLDSIRDAEKIKAINERIKQLQNVNPGANELTDMEILNYQQNQGGGTTEATGSANKGGLPRFDQQRGFTNVSRQNDPVVQAEADKTLSSVIPLIAKGDFSRSEEALQAIIDLGLADSEESAAEVLYDLLYSEEDQQDQ